jgi:hypothetical protein
MFSPVPPGHTRCRDCVLRTNTALSSVDLLIVTNSANVHLPAVADRRPNRSRRAQRRGARASCGLPSGVAPIVALTARVASWRRGKLSFCRASRVQVYVQQVAFFFFFVARHPQ